MKKSFFFLAIFTTQSLIAQNVGIGITTPSANLHIRNGVSGATVFPSSQLAVESNVNTYVNLLSPAVNETAILFGQPGSAANGVIMYNNPATPNGFQFRNNGNLTRMSLASNGNMGIGLLSPGAKLSISATGTELAGSAASNIFRTHAGTLGSVAGDELSLASIGYASSNNSSLGIKAYRTVAGADWSSTSLLLQNDVDNSPRINGSFLALASNGNIGIGTPQPAAKLHVSGGDGSMALFGPTNFGGQLYVGAGNNQNLAQTAQVLSSDGSLYIDPASNRSICLGCYQPRDIFINPYGGKVAIGPATPVYPLDVKGNLYRVGNFENTSANQNYEGLSGSCIVTPNFGTGVSGYGGKIGLFGSAVFGGAGDRYGIQGFGRNGAVDNYGMYAYAEGGTGAYGIYATAGGGAAISLAGYFAGSVFTTGFYTGSDRKLKNDIKPLNNA
ncbi:MAG: hypothetical protein ABIN74_09615, partial [Ferruginibacter sp.]